MVFDCYNWIKLVLLMLVVPIISLYHGICINDNEYHHSQDSKTNMQDEILCNLFDLIMMVIERSPLGIDELDTNDDYNIAQLFLIIIILTIRVLILTYIFIHKQCNINHIQSILPL